jgi:hypothetical protein
LVTFRVAAVAAVLLLGLGGCAGADRPTVRLGATGGQAGQQLTVAQAREVFDAFWPRFEQLAVDYSPAAARRLTVGAELPAQLFFKGTSGPTITKLINESFYIPRLTGYPRWFWATGQQAGRGSAGHLFVMVQSARSAPWQTAMALYDLNFSNAHMLRTLASAITKDAQGYAAAVPLGDPGLDVPPSAMPATYAHYLNGQTTHAVRRLFQPGLNTTYYISVDHEVFRGAGRYGWRDTDHQAPAQLPVYALRSSTGGAVVIFSTYDTGGWVAASSSAALPAHPSGVEGNYVPPTFVLQALGITSVRTGTRLMVTAVDRVLASVQPHGAGSIDVLINNGAATRVQEFNPTS